MIGKFMVNPTIRKLAVLIAASLLHYAAVIRTHILFLHQKSQIPEDNVYLIEHKEKESYRMLNVSLTKNSSLVASDHVHRKLPMFNETGGIIIFIHIAKTGGSSIREGFRKIPNISVKRIMNEAQLKGKRDKIDWYVSAHNNQSTLDSRREKVLLLEIHGYHGEPMSIFQIHKYIQYWRVQAAANKKQVFVFTLFREPAAFHLSYFTFFRHPNCHELWCDRPVLPQTETHLIQSMIPNHQCQFLARTFAKIATNNTTMTTPVTESECESVQTLLLLDVDWIGTTDSLSKTTLPLLTYIVAGNASIANDFVIVNRQNVKKKLQLHDISNRTIHTIRQKSNIDEQLYHWARRQYVLSMWSNFAVS
jgi:hypothetical protein